MPEHIVKAFEQDLAKLKRIIAQMGGVAESQFEAAIRCVVRRDAELAAEVIGNDARLDRYEHEIGEDVVRLLALRQPMAADLREVVSALKIAADLERIGDYAANIAKRSVALSQLPPVKPVAAIPRLGRLVQEIIKDVLDGYGERDLDKALAAWRRDEEADALYTSLVGETLSHMMAERRNVTPGTHLLFIAKNIERIGDHATNIAEMVHFLIAGRPIREARPKSDGASFAVPTPGGRGETTA